MKGGILQLATVGREDSVLIKNPEIFHFKKIYLPYSKFSIDNNSYTIGRKKFESIFDFEINKDGDLLKDLMFYVDIPFFDIIKTIEEKTEIFDKNKSDKVYYNHNSLKSLVYYSGNNNFYIIPENIFYFKDSNSKSHILDSDKILSINSEEYSKYFDESSKFEEFDFGQDYRNQSIKYLKTIDSYWFSSFIKKVIEDKESNIILMDFSKFTNWLNKKMENRMFFDYQNIFNTQNNRQLYQINFLEDRNINELKKYFQIFEKIDNINNANYIDENLDIDESVKNILIDKEHLTTDDKDYLKKAITYPSRNILLSILKLYDDSKDNFHTMFKMFKVAEDNNNEIIEAGSKVYDILTWKEYTSKYFDVCFDNDDLEIYSSYFIDNYKTTISLVESQLELLWNKLDFKINNKINSDYIFTIIYTFITRYNNFNNFDTINFLDFFEKSGENTFTEELNKNINNYSNVNVTNLTNINKVYGKNLDLTIIFNYVFYSLAEDIKKLNLFDNFDSISKPNIQFVYWWRNKLSNMIFLRYMRIKNNTTTKGTNYNPNFDSFRDIQEVINFFYTYIPNESITLNEVRNEIYNLIHNRSYIGLYSDSNINVSKYLEIEKINLVKNSTFEESKNGIIKGKLILNIKSDQYNFNDGHITFNDNCKIINNYFDSNYKLYIRLNNKIYNSTFSYVNSRIEIIIDNKVILNSDFEIVVEYNQAVNKYYFEYNSVQIEKSDLIFNSDNIIFETMNYIDTNKFNYKLESEISSINSDIEILSSVLDSVNSTNKFTFKLNLNSYIPTDLLTDDYTNYSTILFRTVEYTNGIITNFKILTEDINSQKKNILSIISTTDNYFNIVDNSEYILEYNSIKYNITIEEYQTDKFIINGLDIGFLDNETNFTNYKILENKEIVTNIGKLLFTNNLVTYDVSDSDNDNIFTYDGTLTDISGIQLLEFENKYYSVNITTQDLSNKIYKVDTLDSIKIDGAKLIFNNDLIFNNKATNIQNDDNYIISFKSTIDTTKKQSVKILPFNYNGTNSNFDLSNTKFRYALFTNQDSEYNNLISSNAFNFSIKGELKFEERYNLFSTNYNIISNNIVSFNFESNKKYFLEEKYKTGKCIIKEICFSENNSDNFIYFQNKISNQYIIEQDYKFNLLESIDIVEAIEYYDNFDMSGKIMLENDRKLLQFDISNNIINYNKYIKSYLGSYYVKYQNSTIHLSSPVLTSDSLKFNFKICNENKLFEVGDTLETFNFFSINNNYLPNLIKYTSFYPQKKSDKVYDLMDYFIQTPMVIYLDNSEKKNGHIILNNISINFDIFDKIEILKLNDDNLFINQNIHSNQIIRYENNMISSTFDENIYYTVDNNLLLREQLLKTIDKKLDNILERDYIGNIIETIEQTDNILKSIDIENSLHKIKDGKYGKTSQRLIEIFNNYNIIDFLGIAETFEDEISNKYSENNYDITSNLNCNNYNFFSKLVIDFFGLNNTVSFDKNLGYSTNIGDGKDIFYTNIKILLNEPKVNKSMLEFLNNYKIEILNQIDYIENNILWLSLFSKSIKSDFNNFISYQQEYRNLLYDNSSKEYTFELTSTSNNSNNLTKEYYINEEKVEIDLINKKIKSTQELQSINKNINSSIIKPKKESYFDEKHKFNYHGCCLIKDNNFVIDKLNLAFDISKNYMFVDDNENCNIVIKEDATDFFKIKDYINKYLINSKIYEINSTDDISYNNTNLYLYEFEKTSNNQLQINDFVIIDNYIAQVIDTSNNISIISKNNLALENNNYFKGTKKTSTTDTSDNIMNYNLLNMLDLSETVYSFDKLLNIKHFNTKLSSEPDSLICSIEDGILNFTKIDNIFYTFLSTPNIYKLGNIILENKPLVLEDFKITYFNLQEEIGKDYIYYNGNKVFTLDKKEDSVKPENIWIYKDNIYNTMNEYSVSLDLSNMNIELDENIYENFKDNYFYFNEEYYGFKDFSRNDISSTSEISKIYILTNCFDDMKTFYSHIEKELKNIVFNKINNKYEIPNLNNMIIKNDNFRYKIDNVGKTDRDTIMLFKNNTTNEIFSRPINISLPTTEESFNRLFYSTYSDLSYNNETDSVLKLDVSAASSGSTLDSEKIFYLVFNKFTSGSNKYSSNGLNEYKFFIEKVSKIEITTDNPFLKIENNGTNINEFKIIVKNNYKYIIGNFNKVTLYVNFIFDSVEYRFPIIYYLLVDDNYDQRLNYYYDASNKLLREPLIIFNQNDKITDSSSNFIETIPKMFKSDVNGNAVLDIETVSKVLIMDKNYKYQESYDDIYTDGSVKKIIEKSNNNKIYFHWELLDYLVIKDNVILNFDDFTSIKNKINYLILKEDDNLYFVNIIEKNERIEIDHNFEKTIKVTAFVNLNNGIAYNNKLYLNQRLNILYIKFGILNIGEILKIGKLIILIKDYNVQFNGYSYQILNPTNIEIKNSYNSFLTLGSINNYYNKNNLSFTNTKNLLINKDPNKFLFGDFILNDNFIGIYKDNLKNNINDFVNYTFNKSSILIYLQKLDDKWYYFGNYITGNTLLVAKYESNGDILEKIFKIRSVINHIIEWDEDYTEFLNNLTNKNKDYFIFTATYLPLRIEKINNKPDNGIILIKDKYYVIKDHSILNFKDNLDDELYYMLEFDETSYTLSNITSHINEFDEIYYKNTKLYYSEETIIKDSNILNTNIANLELTNAKTFYYKQENKYIYPLYLVKNNSKFAEGETIEGVVYYYDSSGLTTTIIKPTDYLDINDYIYNPIYIYENNKYTYPLYVNKKFLINDDIITTNEKLLNMNISVDIINRPSIIQFASNPILNATKDVSYSYNITMDPSDCIVKAKNIPLWLNLNNNIISGTPSEKGKYEVELIGEKDKLSIIQKFNINVTDLSTNFQIISNPTTMAKTNINYEYELNGNNTLDTIESQFIPNWLDLSNNKLTGTPYDNSVGLNNISLKVKDISGNIVFHEFSIFVNLKNPIFINSAPSTTVVDNSYTYNLSIKNIDNDNYTIGFNQSLPNWLSLDMSNLTLSTNGNVIDFTDNLVDLNIYNNDISNIKINHRFRLNDTSDIYITSKPKINCFTYSSYEYNITTNKSNFTSKLISSSSWLNLTEDHKLIGRTNFSTIDISNNIIIEVTDSDNNSSRQEFTIEIFNFNDKVIEIMEGIQYFKNNINYNNHLILNKKEIVCKGFVDYGNFKELIIFDYIDFLGKSELLIPSNINSTAIDIINNKPVMLNENIIEYNIELEEQNINPKLYIYYIDSKQKQLRIFDCEIQNLANLVVNNENFLTFYNNHKSKSFEVFIENYIPIQIENVVNNTIKFNITPFRISDQVPVLIEEKNEDIVNIYNCNIKIENGFIKIDQDIENINSDFFLNRIIPIRIRDGIIQFIRPTISENYLLGVSDKLGMDEWIKIPITKMSKPQLVNNKWKMEITSKYLNLLLKNKLFDRISYDNRNNVEFKIEGNKYFLIYNYIPNTLDDFVYLKNTNYFNYLYKQNSTWKSESQLTANVPDDKTLGNLLTNDWKLDFTFTKIPVEVESSNSKNSFVIKKYEIGNLDLNSNSIEYYIDNPNNLVLNSGIDDNNELEILTKNNIINSNTFIYHKVITNNITKNNITEPFTSVKTYIDKLENLNNYIELSFNLSKSLIDWTSITFHKNKKYQSTNQTFEKYIEIDGSGNLEIKDDLSNNILMLEELNEESEFLKIVKLLSENNFEKLLILNNIRKVENIVFEYIKAESNSKLFWNNPNENINIYLSHLNNINFDVSNYMIHKNCIINKNELNNVNNETIFKRINNNSIERVAYLDSQFSIYEKNSKYIVYRDINMILKAISDFVNKDLNSYFGANSHLLLQNIYKLYENKESYIDYLKDGKSFNKVYNLLSMEKILINKQWEFLKNNDLGFSNILNPEFTDELVIKYDNKESLIYNGLKIDENFNKKTFGFESYNKINFYNFSDEKIIFNDFILQKNGKEEILAYNLQSNNIYHYNIVSSNNIIFKPDFNYDLNMLEGNNISTESPLEIIKFDSNNLEFSTNNYLDDYNKITLDVTKIYDVNKTEFTGYLYNDILIEDLSTQVFDLYYDTTNIKILNISKDISGMNIDIISKNIINTNDFVRLEKLIGIKSQEINNNKLYITFTKLFVKSNFENILDQVYIKSDDKEYLLYKDGSSYYIDKNELLDLKNNFVIFGYIKLIDIEDKLSDNFIYKLTTTEDIENTIFKNNSPLLINYSIDDIKIDNVEFINNREIKIFLKDEITEVKQLKGKFNMEKDDPIILDSYVAKNTPHIVEIENDILLAKNSMVSLFKDSSDISGTIFDIVNDNNILFNTTNRINLHEISELEYKTKITNILNISEYNLSSNTLSFDLVEPITFDLIDNFEYFVELDSSYQKIDNNHIDLNSDQIIINLESYTYTNIDPSFNFKQVYINLKSVHSYDFNYLVDIKLKYKRKTLKYEKFYLNYLTTDNKEIGNFIYSISENTGAFNWQHFSKLLIQDKDNILTFREIGKKDTMIYFATKNKLETGLETLNKKVRFDYNLVFNSIQFVTYNFTEGIVYEVDDDFNKKIMLNTGEYNNNYQIFNDLGINLFISFYHKNADIDLIASKELSFKFPKELEYDNYRKTIITTKTIKEKVKWKNDIQYKIFDYIDFYLNDVKVDSMDENIYRISNLYLDKQKELLQKPYNYQGNFRLFIPTFFWFSKNSSNYLPLIALENTEIRIKMKLNKLENLIENNLNGITSDLPKNSSITLMSDLILLDHTERRRFAEYNHEYLIERFVKYNNNILRKENELVNLHIKGLIKDIFWITKSPYTDKPYLSNEVTIRDTITEDYHELLRKYNIYKNNNFSFTSEISSSNLESFLSLENILKKIENKDSIIDNIKEHPYLSQFDLTYILYLFFTKFIFYDELPDSKFNADSTKAKIIRTNFKLDKLILYFKQIYQNKITINKISPIKNIEFKADGQSILAKQSGNYFKYLTGKKLNKINDFGVYYYTFSLYPLDLQPSGHLNFNILKNSVLNLNLDKRITSENLFLKTIVKEYQILRIIGGMASLSWN